MPENAEQQEPDGYDFAALRFIPQNSKVVCLETQKEIFLRRNLSEFLLLLLKKPRAIIAYREFCQSVAAWTIYKDVSQVMRTIHTTKGELVKNLRILREDFDLIEAVPAKGYRLGADVDEFHAADEPEIVSAKVETNFAQTKEPIFEQKFFGGHSGQAFFACAIYAALFVVALFVELAYQFDGFKNLAFKLAAPIFLWIWIASLAGLFVGTKLAAKSAVSGLWSAAGFFLSAGLLLYVLLGAFLPARPITEANFQTLSAPAAYLKSVFYFFGLGIFLIVTPFVNVIRLESEAAKNNRKAVLRLRRIHYRGLSAASTLWLSPAFLLCLTVVALISSLLLTGHLFENLKPNPYLNLFMQLVLWRWFLYFALAAECLIWYWTSLNRLKARSLEIAATSNRPAK